MQGVAMKVSVDAIKVYNQFTLSKDIILDNLGGWGVGADLSN